MSRARNIKPGFFKNDRLAECDPLARILFAGLWCEADREGRLEDRPKRIKAECLPYDDCDCDELLDQLASRGFIRRYIVDGKGFIQVESFKTHQNPHVKEAASLIPEPSESEASTVQAPDKNSSFPADSLSLDSPSLIPDSLQRPPASEERTPPPADPSADLLGSNISKHPAVDRLTKIVVDAYHATLPKCAAIQVLSPKRVKRIALANKLARQVCGQQGWEFDPHSFWSSYFGECLADPWLRGETANPNNPRWKQNLHVLIEEDRFAEIMDRAITRLKSEDAA